MKKSEGIPISIVAIHPDGTNREYSSLAEASIVYGVTAQYISKACKQDYKRPYRSNDICDRPVRFAYKSNFKIE